MNYGNQALASGIQAISGAALNGLDAFLNADARAAQSGFDRQKTASEIMRNNAVANYQTKKAQIDRQLADQRANALKNIPRNVAGITPDQQLQLEDFRDSGQFGPARFGPQDQGIAPIQEQPQNPGWYSPEVGQNFNRGNLLSDIIASASTSNPDQISSALDQLTKTDLGKQLMGGGVSDEMKSIALSLLKGSPIFSQNSVGTVLDKFSGQQSGSPAGTQGTPLVQVNTGELAGAPKGSQSKQFNDIVVNQQGLDGLQYTESLYEPEFLTYGGKGQAFLQQHLNKLNPGQRDAFTQRRRAFITAMKQDFLRFKKWATGVAAGPREIADIEAATLNENMSPEEFESTLPVLRSLRRRLNARVQAALKAGINNEEQFREYLQVNPLSSIPTLQERGDQLEQMGYKPDQVKGILQDEGYQ